MGKGRLMTWDLKEPECLSQARLMVAAPEFVYEQLKLYSEHVEILDGKEEHRSRISQRSRVARIADIAEWRVGPLRCRLGD